MAVTDVLSGSVHESQASLPRRTSEHHHHRPVRPLHPHRRRPPGVLQVSVSPIRLATGLTLSIVRSIGYSEECLGIHLGNKHDADLGDGDDKKAQQFLARQYYFPVMGTCWESFAGAQNDPTSHSFELGLTPLQVDTTSVPGSRTGHSQTVAHGL